jgi:tetratricopeptide (TPR) repeat protein
MARTVTARYAGQVEKFIGDAVMAVWGTPVATEEDAERAVRAALDIVSAVPELGTKAGVPGLVARAGVVTAEVAVTLGATGEGMVAGDAVNTASRVQSAAEPGSVLVDTATRRLAGSAIELADAGGHALKGKAEPTRLWRATRVLAGVGGSQRIDGLEAPLTGRDAELRTIRELYHAAAGRRVPRLVLVSGPAGVGKSRLGWEFEKYADGLAAEVWWHRGRCLSYGEGVAFWALAEIVRQRLEIAEEDPAEVAAAKLTAGLDRIVPDLAERVYVGARLGRLLGVAYAAGGGVALSREELFAGWRLFFERLAASRPVVLLIEDAQYADSGLLAFLDHLIDWTKNLPVYVLIFARPELDHIRPGFGAGRNRSTLTLDPLDPVSMDQLVDALVPDIPLEARSKITGHAQGIPLFGIETVRSLIDQGIVHRVGGVYRLTGDIGELAVPDSLHALLAARLDALDPGMRRLVADAAVLGTSFSAEALISVSGQDDNDVRAALADLVHREVLTVSADPLSPERGSYQFGQQMLRQVAYDTLSRRDRKARHLKVAAHLRAAFAQDGEEAADVIARHYLDALHAIPGDPDTSDIRDQAVVALVRAAERAKRTGAPALAATSYATAAQLSLPTAQPGGAIDQPDVGTLWERAAESALAADQPAALEYAARARDYYLECGKDRAAARVQTVTGNALRFQGRLAEARAQLTAAVEVLRTDPDRDTVRALLRLAIVEVHAGSPDAGPATAEALDLGQAVGVDPSQLSDLLAIRGTFLNITDRRPEAIAYLREAARLATQADDSMVLGAALINLADALNRTDPAVGAETARTAAEQLRRVGTPILLAVAIATLTVALMILGDWDATEEEFTRAVDTDGLGDHNYLVAHRAWLAAMRGNAAATETILAGLSDLRSSEDPQDQAVVSLVEAFTAAARHQPETALRHARDTLAHVGALGISHDFLCWGWPLAARAAYELDDSSATRDLLGMLDSHPPGHLDPVQRAERDLVRARLSSRDGDPVAGDMFGYAISSMRELSTPYHLAHGLLDHAQHLTRLHDGVAAEAAISEARDIAVRLRCQPLLDRAADLMPEKPLVQA